MSTGYKIVMACHYGETIVHIFVEKVRAYFVAPGKFRSPAKACMLPNQPFNSCKKTVKTKYHAASRGAT